MATVGFKVNVNILKHSPEKINQQINKKKKRLNMNI